MGVKRSLIPLFGLLFFSAAAPIWALPEYAAYSGSNCMACHTGPTGGFGRKPVSHEDTGYITDKLYLSGDFRFLALYDERNGYPNQVVLFPMEAALSFGFTPKPYLTISASQDFGILREAYAMFHNEAETAYVRAGYFTLPYGILFEDHTAFIKEGRIQTGETDFEEVGIGAGLFSVQYKDSGLEAGFSGKPWFANLAITAGVVGQTDRAFPSAESGTKRAKTVRGGYLGKNFCLGVSNYTNDSQILDRRILRYGAFGWYRIDKWVLFAEHDEGEDSQYSVTGTTQSAADYVELVYSFPFPGKTWPSYAKLRYERMDPNRSLSNDVLQRWVASYKFQPMDNLAIESYIEKNLEQPKEIRNDDIFVIAHVFF